VTPIFSTSYSGLFKSFIDVLDPVTNETYVRAAAGKDAAGGGTVPG